MNSVSSASGASVPTKVPMYNKISYGAGSMADIVMQETIELYVVYFYITTMGISPMMVGLAVMIPRLWDTVTDPVMGNISDNFRSRWGRRRPFIVLGGVLICIPFTMVWMVPSSLGEVGILLWFVVCMLGYSTFYTVYFVPYFSLGAEMSTDYNERTHIASVRMFIGRIAGLGMAPVFELVYNKDLFSNEQVGFTAVALVFSALTIAGALWAVSTTREATYVQTQEKINFIEAIRYTLRNGPFVILLIVTVVSGVAFWSVLRLGRFVNVYYVHGGSESSLGRINTIAELISVFVAFASIILVDRMCKYFGKLAARIVLTTIVMFLQMSSWFLFNPDHPYLYLFYAAGTGLLYASTLIYTAMIPDVADDDELKTGLRREGMFFGVWGLFGKLTFSIGPLLSGIILELIGFKEGQEMQTEHTLWWMRFIFAFGAVPLSIATILVLFKYPLTEKRVRAMRAELDKRHLDSDEEGPCE